MSKENSNAEPEKCPTCGWPEAVRGQILDFNGTSYFECRNEFHNMKSCIKCGQALLPAWKSCHMCGAIQCSSDSSAGSVEDSSTSTITNKTGVAMAGRHTSTSIPAGIVRSDSKSNAHSTPAEPEIDHLAFSILHGTFDDNSPGGCSCDKCAELMATIKRLQNEEATKFYNEHYPPTYAEPSDERTK